MPRFAANVSTMYLELELPDRFPAVAATGFTAVEFLQPYGWSVSQIRSWLEDNSLEMILLNTSPGETANHEVGLAAVRGEEERFQHLFRLCSNLGRHGSYPMCSKCLINFVIVRVDIRLCRKRSSRNSRVKSAVVSMAVIQYLMNHLSEVDLDRLSRNESVVPEKSILAPAFSER